MLLPGRRGVGQHVAEVAVSAKILRGEVIFHLGAEHVEQRRQIAVWRRWLTIGIGLHGSRPLPRLLLVLCDVALGFGRFR